MRLTSLQVIFACSLLLLVVALANSVEGRSISPNRKDGQSEHAEVRKRRAYDGDYSEGSDELDMAFNDDESYSDENEDLIDLLAVENSSESDESPSNALPNSSNNNIVEHDDETDFQSRDWADDDDDFEFDNDDK